jgi:hypothetical protein
MYLPHWRGYAFKKVPTSEKPWPNKFDHGTRLVLRKRISLAISRHNPARMGRNPYECSIEQLFLEDASRVWPTTIRMEQRRITQAIGMSRPLMLRRSLRMLSRQGAARQTDLQTRRLPRLLMPLRPRCVSGRGSHGCQSRACPYRSRVRCRQHGRVSLLRCLKVH